MNIKDEINAAVSAALAPFQPLLATFGSGSKPLTAQVTTPELLSAVQHPVLTEAFAKGIDTAEKLTALVADAEKGRELLAAPAPEPHPVQVAALASGVDSPEKFAQLEAEAKAGRESMSTAREEAEAAAVAYYGANAEGLAAAKKQIAAEANLAQLKEKTDQFWSLAPGAGKDGKRLSQGTAPTPQDLSKNANRTPPAKAEAFSYDAYNGIKPGKQEQ